MIKIIYGIVVAQALTRFPRDPRSPNERLRIEAMHEQQPGYGSDGSETLSIHSAQSMPARYGYIMS